MAASSSSSAAFTFIVVALMNIFLVVRHTRAEEEAGRAELVRAAAVGRHAPLTAALLVVAAADVVVGAIVATGLIALDLPVAGSVAFGAALAAVGIAFAAVTAVAAQVSERARLATGLTACVLGASFVLRAAGDSRDSGLSWLSPIGWGQAVRAFAGERWWTLALPLAFGAVLLAVAYALASHRDVGAGLLRPRPGSPTASALLVRPEGLALRLQRGVLAGWAAGLFLTGASYGSIGRDIGDFIGDNEQLRDLLTQTGGDLTDSYFSTTMLILALIGTGFAIQSTIRLRSEETSGLAEPLLATAVSRTRWAGSHLLIALGGSAVLLGAAGLGTGLAYGVSIGEPSAVPRLVGSALVYAPAMWVLIGVTVLLYGLVPRFVVAAWAALAVCLVVGFLGQLLDLPAWVRQLSPFEHTSRPPSAPVEFAPLAVLTVLAVVLIAAGLAAFRRRDIG